MRLLGRSEPTEYLCTSRIRRLSGDSGYEAFARAKPAVFHRPMTSWRMRSRMYQCRSLWVVTASRSKSQRYSTRVVEKLNFRVQVAVLEGVVAASRLQLVKKGLLAQEDFRRSSLSTRFGIICHSVVCLFSRSTQSDSTGRPTQSGGSTRPGRGIEVRIRLKMERL